LSLLQHYIQAAAVEAVDTDIASQSHRNVAVEAVISGGVWPREGWDQARERSGTIATFTVLRTILRAFLGSTLR
jgi:hypothetical protein